MVLIILILPIGLGGCTVPLDIHLINNSGHEITITFNTDSGELSHDTYVFQVGKGEIFEEAVADKGDTITIYMGEKILNYEGKSIPMEFVEQTGIIFINRILRLQLESDGKIYILKPGSPIPAKEFPSQPTGYPLVPEVSENPNIHKEEKES